ncbi:MAG: tripartite tricarboxylate transporter TctB family protein [Betaproteobacteria bacterium]|nr:tripartite tricarboxylate transporter TctB family protein [Betaproteobacteria bacterium]
MSAASGQRVVARGDLWSGAALAALGGFVINEARQWEYLTAEGPGPGFFPLWYGIAMVLLSLVLIISALRRTPPAAGHAATDWAGIGRALLCWAAFALSALLLKWLGLLLSLALLTVFIAKVMYGKPMKIALATAAGNVAGFYLVFQLALGVELPVGLLGF